MTGTPIYVSVLRDLQWHPGMLSPPLDLDALLAASYDRPRQDAPPSVTEQASPPAARSRGRSPGAASTTKRATRRTTTQKPTGDADA